jgi:CheY-like chemotaxis protein
MTFGILRKNRFSALTPDVPMKILILTTDQELALLRQRVLEDAGHQVTPLVTEKEVLEAAAKNVPFDIALVCHHLPNATARKVIRIFREGKRDGKVIYINHLYGEWPEVEADRYVVGADGPDALIKIVAESGPQTSPTPI